MQEQTFSYTLQTIKNAFCFPAILSLSSPCKPNATVITFLHQLCRDISHPTIILLIKIKTSLSTTTISGLFNNCNRPRISMSLTYCCNLTRSGTADDVGTMVTATLGCQLNQNLHLYSFHWTHTTHHLYYTVICLKRVALQHMPLSFLQHCNQTCRRF